jgi:ribosomal protein L14E/L6E/L27E
MNIEKGTIVYSLAGHDKGDFQVVMDFDDTYAKVCDGKHRPLERLKKKKLIHLKLTNTVLSEEKLRTNKSIRISLRPFNEAAALKAPSGKQITVEVVE